MSKRVIARLDIKGPNLVKGVHLEGLRVLGKPARFAARYYEDGADELIFQDVVASLYERNSLKEIIRATAERIFIPLCVGGGVRTVEDIRDVLRAGADKVSVNTAAVRDPGFVPRAVQRFGSSTIVVSIEASRQPDGSYEAFTDNGRERTGRDAVEWARRAESMGAGELLVTSVDQEGTGRGYDVELIRRIADQVDVPVIALGGAGRPEHLAQAIASGADAAAAAALFHYQAVSVLDNSGDEFDPAINLTAMRKGATYGQVEPTSIRQTKTWLLEHGVRVRGPVTPAGTRS